MACIRQCRLLASGDMTRALVLDAGWRHGASRRGRRGPWRQSFGAEASSSAVPIWSAAYRPIAARPQCDGNDRPSHTRDLAATVAKPMLLWRHRRPEMIRGAWIKPGAIVIDVGINGWRAKDKTRPGGEQNLSAMSPSPRRSRAGAITQCPECRTDDYCDADGKYASRSAFEAQGKTLLSDVREIGFR